MSKTPGAGLSPYEAVAQLSGAGRGAFGLAGDPERDVAAEVVATGNSHYWRRLAR